MQVHNTSKAVLTLAAGSPEAIVLQPGNNEVNESAFEALDSHTQKYVTALVQSGVLIPSRNTSNPVDEDEDLYAKDADGNRIQKTDADGEPVFDEHTGDPVWLLASEVEPE